MSQDRVQDIQGELLAETVDRVYQGSKYYREAFDRRGLKASDMRRLDDLEKLPFTDRADLEKKNWDFLSVDRKGIAELVSTTGTTGEPVTIALTRNDLERLAYNEEKSFTTAGAEKGDLFHLAVTCDNLFIAGIAYYSGLMRLGASVVRIGPQNIIRHLDLIRKYRPRGIVAVPTYVIHMARRANERGIDAKQLGLEKVVLIGDSIRNEDFSLNSLGYLLENAFGRIYFSTYGITEGQVSFCECHLGEGLHSHPDLILAEIIDENGRSLPDGETGELVLTTLQIEGMPLIRYRTGDITFKISAPCKCGRTSPRIGPITGRKYHRLKFKGVTLYPKNIENAIIGLEGVVNYQIDVFTGDDHTDDILLKIGTYRNDRAFKHELIDSLRAKARVSPKVQLKSPEELNEMLFKGGSRKPIIFNDLRNSG